MSLKYPRKNKYFVSNFTRNGLYILNLTELLIGSLKLKKTVKYGNMIILLPFVF